MILKSKQTDAAGSAAAGRGNTATSECDEVLVGSFEDNRTPTVTNIMVRVVKRGSVLVL